MVRVGTHALKLRAKSTLWRRLSQHKGTVKHSGGNHRGSIFRQIVGAALIQRDGIRCPTWEQFSNHAPRDVREVERPTEAKVSKVIGEMPFLWLPVDDDPGPTSKRGVIEEGSIALLSNFRGDAIDLPSCTWLGRHCNRVKVRLSGLWNSNHVDEAYDPAFLDTLEELVRAVKEQ